MIIARRKRIYILLAALLAWICVGVMVVKHIADSRGKVNIEGEVGEETPGALFYSSLFEEEEFLSTDLKMVNAASVSIVGKRGLRFATFIGDNVDLEARYGEGYKFGTLFIPASAVQSAEELTLDARFGVNKDIPPAFAEWDGNEENLVRVDSYEKGRLFYSLLNVEEEGVPEKDYLNSTFLARAYVKKADGEVVYLNSVRHSPAAVAGRLLRYADKKWDGVEALKRYVGYVTLDAQEVYNVGEGNTVALALTNVENFPVFYKVNGVETNEYTAGAEGYYERVTASILLGDGLHEKTFAVNVLGDKYSFKNEYYQPSGQFTFPIYGEVNEVKRNGAPISGYSVADGVLRIPKAAFTEEKNQLTVLTGAGNAEVEVVMRTAQPTRFGEGELGLELMGKSVNTGEAAAVEGGLKIPVDTANTATRIDLNEDYIRAMFAYPNLTALYLDAEVQNLNAEEDKLVGYAYLKDDGELALGQTRGTERNLTVTHLLTRAHYNHLVKAGGLEENLSLLLGEKQVAADTAIVLKGVTVQRADGGTFAPDNARVNRIYADAQLVLSKGLSLPLSTEAALGALRLDGKNAFTPAFYKAEGSVVTLTADGVNGALRDKTSLLLSSANSDEIYSLTTKAMVDEHQYVNVTGAGDGDTYKFPFSVGAGEVLCSVRLNGVEVAKENIDEAGVTLKKRDLPLGHNALEIRVERTVNSGGIRWTAVDTYYRSVCAITDVDLHSAMTFEGGMNPFLSVIGGRAKLVEGNTMWNNFNYATECYYPENADMDTSLQANRNVLRVTALKGEGVRLYFATSYIAARRRAVAEAGVTGEAGLCSKVLALTASGSNMGWKLYTKDGQNVSTGAEMHSIDVRNVTYNPTLNYNGEGVRPLFENDLFGYVYDGVSEEILQEYIYMEIEPASTQKIAYFDDFFMATSESRYRKEANRYSIIGGGY